MPTTEERVAKLRIGAAIVMFDRSLRSVSSTVFVYAFIIISIGIIFTFASASAWGVIAFGLALAGEGFYIRKVRSPKVILLAGFTLAAFAIWLISGFVMAATGNGKGGGGIIAGIFLAIGAWNMLSSYNTYKTLLRDSDPVVTEEVRAIVDALRTAKAETETEFAEWKARGFAEKGFWRLRKVDDLFLLVHFEDKTFGRGGAAERVVWTAAQGAGVEVEGGKWIGKNLNAKLILPTEEIKIELSPSMLERLQKMTGTSSYLSSSFASQ